MQTVHDVVRDAIPCAIPYILHVMQGGVVRSVVEAWDLRVLVEMSSEKVQLMPPKQARLC